MTSVMNPRAQVDRKMVQRQNDLFDLHAAWSEEHPGEDPDDDLEFVAAARRILGLSPLPEAAEG